MMPTNKTGHSGSSGQGRQGRGGSNHRQPDRGLSTRRLALSAMLAALALIDRKSTRLNSSQS